MPAANGVAAKCARRFWRRRRRSWSRMAWMPSRFAPLPRPSAIHPERCTSTSIKGGHPPALYFGGADGLGAHCDRAVKSVPAAGVDRPRWIRALGHAYRAYALSPSRPLPARLRGIEDPAQTPPRSARKNQRGFDTLNGVRQRDMAAASWRRTFRPKRSPFPPGPRFTVSFPWTVRPHHRRRWPGRAGRHPGGGTGQRDQLFEAHMRMTMLGLASDAHRAHLASVRDGTS